jgi:acyl carrier protein
MTTLERLQALLKKDFDLEPGRLHVEAKLADLDIDSLRMIEILFCVEDAFKIKVPGDQAELKARLGTVGDLVAYIDTLVADQRDGATGTAS